MQVFLSYRQDGKRQNSKAETGNVADIGQYLREQFGADKVVLCADKVSSRRKSPLPNEVRRRLGKAESEQAVVVALVGPDWARRLELAGDPVQGLLHEAIKRHIPWVPVLVEDAQMPGSGEVPETLRSLLIQPPLRLTNGSSFKEQLPRLLARIEGCAAGWDEGSNSVSRPPAAPEPVVKPVAVEPVAKPVAVEPVVAASALAGRGAASGAQDIVTASKSSPGVIAGAGAAMASVPPPIRSSVAPRPRSTTSVAPSVPPPAVAGPAVPGPGSVPPDKVPSAPPPARTASIAPQVPMSSRRATSVISSVPPPVPGSIPPPTGQAQSVAPAAQLGGAEKRTASAQVSAGQAGAAFMGVSSPARVDQPPTAQPALVQGAPAEKTELGVQPACRFDEEATAVAARRELDCEAEAELDCEAAAELDCEAEAELSEHAVETDAADQLETHEGLESLLVTDEVAEQAIAARDRMVAAQMAEQPLAPGVVAEGLPDVSAGFEWSTGPSSVVPMARTWSVVPTEGQRRSLPYSLVPVARDAVVAPTAPSRAHLMATRLAGWGMLSVFTAYMAAAWFGLPHSWEQALGISMPTVALRSTTNMDTAIRSAAVSPMLGLDQRAVLEGVRQVVDGATQVGEEPESASLPTSGGEVQLQSTERTSSAKSVGPDGLTEGLATAGEEVSHVGTVEQGGDAVQDSAGVPGLHLPRQPSRDQVRQALSGVQARARSCGYEGEMFVNITVEGATGRVINASTDRARGTVASCIARAIRRADFPRFSRKKFRIKVMLKL